MSLGVGNGDCWDVSGVIPVCFSHPPTSFTRSLARGPGLQICWPSLLSSWLLSTLQSASSLIKSIFLILKSHLFKLLLSAFRLEMFPELELLIELEFSKLHSIVAGPAYVRLSDEFSLDVPPTCDWSPLLKWHISHLCPGWRIEVQDHLDISTRTASYTGLHWRLI